MTLPELSGCGWRSFEVYATLRQQDRLLTEYLYPLWTATAHPEWFFVRYSGALTSTDTAYGHRLRLRYRASDEQWRPLVEGVTAAATQVMGCRARTIETQYDPETARYGGPHGLAVAHRVFTADSTAVVRLLATPQRPTLACLVSAHDLLTGLAGNGDQRIEVYWRQVAWVLDQLWGSSVERSRVWAEAEDQLGRLGAGLTAASSWLAEQSGYQHKLRELTVLGGELVSAARDGALSRSLQAILVDLQHMHCNRAGLSLRKEMSAVLLLARATEHGLLP